MGWPPDNLREIGHNSAVEREWKKEINLQLVSDIQLIGYTIGELHCRVLTAMAQGLEESDSNLTKWKKILPIIMYKKNYLICLKIIHQKVFLYWSCYL